MLIDFSDPQLIIFGKLMLAAILGMLVGMERVAAGKSAGGRTFALVAVGACLFVVLGDIVNTTHLGIVNFDPMRIAAAVVTGIGFIGGGLIFLQGRSLQGLTTAAGLWVAAGIGMTIGFGLYIIAVFASMLTLIVFTFMWRVENWLVGLFENLQPLEVVKTGDTDKDSIPDKEKKLPVADSGPHI